MRRPLLPDSIAPSWFVVQVLGTVFVAATLLTAREDSAWVWALYGGCAACWTGFLVTAPRAPRLGASLLGFATVLPAIAAGQADDSSAVLLSAILLGRFAALLVPGVAVIVGLTVLDGLVVTVSGLLGNDSIGEAAGNAGVLLVLALFGMNRRQSELRAKQAEDLLAQTRIAQAEHARAVALDERTRIAREIHDVLAHSLGALGVQLELAEALLTEKSDVDGAARTIRRSRRLAADGLAEARNAVAALREDVPSLTEALESLTEEFRSDRLSSVEFGVTGSERPVSPSATVTLIATAREALTNAAKHAPGSRVDVALEFASGSVCLSVDNEMSGHSGTTGGFGLTGMRERLALAGGTLESGEDGSRWRVRAEVPE